MRPPQPPHTLICSLVPQVLGWLFGAISRHFCSFLLWDTSDKYSSLEQELRFPPPPDPRLLSFVAWGCGGDMWQTSMFLPLLSFHLRRTVLVLKGCRPVRTSVLNFCFYPASSLLSFLLSLLIKHDRSLSLA